jgi:hypothetical protein
MTQIDREEAHRAREEWCAGRRPGQPATFYAGDELRCPGPLTLSRGGVITCGADLHAVAKPGSRVFIRVRRHPALPHPGTDQHCTRCWSWLEVITMHENQRLEATG